MGKFKLDTCIVIQQKIVNVTVLAVGWNSANILHIGLWIEIYNLCGAY